MAAKKKKKAGAKKASRTAMTNVIVGSKVKAFNKSKGVHTSGDFMEALNKKVMSLLTDAAGRAKSNKRATLRPQDL